MKLIRDDAPEKLAHALTLLRLGRETDSPEMRKQHLDGVERIVEMCRDSIVERDPVIESEG
jgi:hypothetical protein